MKKRDRKGLLITFEKTAEGLGGTTQAKILAEALRKLGHDVVWTREPGGTELGQQLRQILLTPRSEAQELSYAAELFMYFADRAQHYKELLKPAIMDGKIIICDRYVDSTFAYQGGGRGWRKALLLRLHHAATGSLMPDLTFVLDGKSHRTKPNDDRFETLDDKFFRRVKREMLRMVPTESRYVLINANRPIETVSAEIMENVERLLKGWEHAR